MNDEEKNLGKFPYKNLHSFVATVRHCCQSATRLRPAKIGQFFSARGLVWVETLGDREALYYATTDSMRPSLNYFGYSVNYQLIATVL